MTRDQIAARVRFNLNDVGITFYSANDINDSLQDGYHETVALARTIESTATVNFTANLSYYNLSSLISDYIHVIGIYNNSSGQWLDYLLLKLLQETDARWETKIGQPKFFTVLDDSYIAIYPKPATTVGSMLVMYKAMANTLSGATTPTVPDFHQVVLEEYSTMDLLEQAEEFTKAGIWMGEYFEEIGQLQSQMNNRNMTDRISMLQDTQMRPLP